LIDNNNDEFVSWHIKFNKKYPDDGYFNFDYFKQFIDKIKYYSEYPFKNINAEKIKKVLDNFDYDEYNFFIENNDLGLL
jgi:hypothetical protein